MDRSPLRLVLGLLLVALGVLWTLQGLGYVGGSFMSGATVWALVGPVVAVLGVVIAIRSRRKAR